MKKRTYKLLFFNHSYLTPIRHGIQAGHAAVELMVKYPKDKTVQTWARKHKTFVILDAGVTPVLKQIFKVIPKELQFATFREPDCGNMITSIAVLIPSDWCPSGDKKTWKKDMKFEQFRLNSKLAK